MMFSSSLFVTMTIGVAGESSFICCSVSSPLIPGIISSSSTRSNLCCLHSSMASVPLLTVTTSYPLFCRKMIWARKSSISSSTHSKYPLLIMLFLF